MQLIITKLNLFSLEFNIMLHITWKLCLLYIKVQSLQRKRLINRTHKLYKFHLLHDLKVCYENIKIE